MHLNRTQEFLIHEFESDLCNDKFDELKFVIEKFFCNELLSKHNSRHNIQHITNAFLIEKLNNISAQITYAYFKLAISYPLDKDLSIWNQKEKHWKSYRIGIRKMLFDSQIAMENEVERLLAEYKHVLSIEGSLK